MNKKLILLAFFFIISSTYSQKKEKIKGSKIVSIEQVEIGEFDNLEVYDNLEVFLVKGNKCAVEVEADDNLHDAIEVDLKNNTLRLRTTKDISGAKKTSLRITYTDNFKMVVLRDKVSLTALSEVKVNEMTFKSYDDSKLFLNADIPNFTLITNDKSKVELNLKSQDAVLEFNKNSSVKALIASNKLKCDMYQKSSVAIEGDVEDIKLRLDNNANFTGKNLVAKNASLILEGSSKSSLNVATRLILEASGKSEFNFFGEGKLEVKRFSDEASINKKIK
ncbi:GIN domain-containing protein [Flavobacterium orientale]|uniref:Putative auto-transporter adhesin head GIN domain-containing protein n=1 Tax=Flavobacterium orientale TaxID=1756020 RepID=A0A917DA49_9FLAO|nr:DUF2807 domain-containing protein [Flavobacterium orientale]GGD16033.1 hypothetical protein GCM10011343_03710 [Flavobacterium orientale]